MITGTQNAVFADPILGDIVVGNRFKQLYLNGVFTALSSESKMRPYVSAGGGWSWFKPTDAGQAALRGSSFSGAGNETRYSTGCCAEAAAAIRQKTAAALIEREGLLEERIQNRSMGYFAVTHFTISPSVADLPCMSRPVRKIFPAAHTTASAVHVMMTTDTTICHIGGPG